MTNLAGAGAGSSAYAQPPPPSNLPPVPVGYAVGYAAPPVYNLAQQRFDEQQCQEQQHPPPPPPPHQASTQPTYPPIGWQPSAPPAPLPRV